MLCASKHPAPDCISGERHTSGVMPHTRNCLIPLAKDSRVWKISAVFRGKWLATDVQCPPSAAVHNTTCANMGGVAEPLHHLRVASTPR